MDVIVIVDGSSDGTLEMLKNKFANFHIIEGNGSWWWTKCMNKGFESAIERGAEFVLILNDDCEIDTNYLVSLWADYHKVPSPSILGSATISIENPKVVEFAGTFALDRWRMKSRHYIARFKSVPIPFQGIHPSKTLNGRGTLIPVALFEKIGFYDEKLVQYGSDDEFVMRALNSGIPVHISWNSCIHNHVRLTSKGATFQKTSALAFIKSFFDPYSINSLQKAAYLYRKHGIAVFTPLYVLYFVLGTTKAYFFKHRSLKFH